MTTFQFLMVQLKAFNFRTQGGWKVVSIPYGTIKRQADGVACAAHVPVSIPYGTIKSLQNKIDKLLTILTLSNYKIEKND